MVTQSKFYIVDAAALPDVFLKVAEAKRLLASQEVSTVNDATQAVGLSRSAFYKYRDCIHPLQNMMNGRVVTFQFMLRDAPGILSEVLAGFAAAGANLLTINSVAPTEGCALVTITAETLGINEPLEDLLTRLSAISGVARAQILAG